MKNILFLVDYYIENISANGICCKNVAEELNSRDYNVFVGTYRQKNAPDIDTVNGVHVIKTWNMPEKPKHKTFFERILYYIKWLWPFYRFPFYEIRERTDAICQTAKRIITKYNVDTVVCTHLPIETLIAGYLLKKEFPDVNFCGYMLDSLSGGQVPRFLPEKYIVWRKTIWEQRLLRTMNKTVLMESSSAHHTRNTEQRAWMKQATFSDVPMFTYHSGIKPRLICGNNVSIVFTGTMSDGMRTPYYFLNVLKQVKNYNIELIFAGNNSCKKSIADILRSCPSITLIDMGPVPHDQALKLIENADVLLNLGNNNSSLVPSKIFEYMSFGKPIISTYSIDDEACIPYLKNYPAALLLDERNTDYEEQAKLVKQFIESNAGKIISCEDLQKRFYNNTPAAFCDIINNL